MGIPKFFIYITQRYPCVLENLRNYQIPEFDNLYLDVNGIIHTCSHPNDSDVSFRISEEAIFKNIFHYIETLFRMIQPQKLFFLAVDGVAPRAKINQQRSRRFSSARDAEILEAKARAKNIEVPKVKRFDPNCITPGTLFMAKLDEQLKYFITYKISTDKIWQKCKVMFSGSRVPGEGEHKIMDYIRYVKSQPGYDPNTRHCLYGLDADLVMLGLCTHEIHFSLLREEVQYGKKQTNIATPEETKFCLFHLSLLREYIDHEFSILKEKLSFPYDIEKIIDDWVLMGFLVGNDFIPHLPNLHIAKGALPILYNVYMNVLPTLDGYINDNGTLMLDRFEKFLEKLSRFDILQFSEHYADLKFLESKTGRRYTETDRQDFKMSEDNDEVSSPKRAQDKELDDVIKSAIKMSLGESDDDDDTDDESDSETYNLEFVQHKKDYYMNKLEYETIDEDFLRKQAEGYVRAIQWNLHYYYNGCCSWSWYYPHHYAPYISDIKDFKELNLVFEMGEPFAPFQQLLAALPPYSKELLPEAFQELLTEEWSPIINYYPKEFQTDLNGKRQEWEAVVLIPFVDETNLVDAMKPYYERLTPQERERNKHGPMYLYSYTEESMGVYKALEYFPDIISYATAEIINRQDIFVPREKLVRGLYPGVKLTVYYPGFPTFRHLEHTASLEKIRVKVFQFHSNKDSMILHIKEPGMSELLSVAADLLGKVVFVNYPYLTEAQVVGVSTCDTKLSLINPQMNYCDENVNEEKLKDVVVAKWNSQKKSIADLYKTRFGIDIGETAVLVYARPLIGSKYTFGSHGKLYFEKQWAQSQTAYAHQVIVKDISAYCMNTALYKTVDEIFTPGTRCFMLGHPHYGSTGKVLEPAVCKKSGRIRLEVTVMQEPWLETVKQTQEQIKTPYMHGTIAAQRLGINSYVFGRITGTVYVKASSDDPLQDEITYNVGLNLKFNKKNEEVVGYTRKENGQWLYSTKVIDLIRSYMVKCPVLFERLSQNIFNDVFSEEQLFNKGTGELADTASWLNEQLQGIETRACGVETLDTGVVKKIEEEVDAFLKTRNSPSKILVMQVKPHLLYKPGLHMHTSPPDSKAQTLLWDRVCCTKENFMVPLGYKGTVIGIQKAENWTDTMYYVLFDEPFPGGLTISGSSEFRAYRLSASDFINITHGQRTEHDRVGTVDVNAESVDAWKLSANQKAEARANAAALAAYRKKNHLQAEPPTSPKLQTAQKNVGESNLPERLGPPPNAYKWKQNNAQNAVNVQGAYGAPRAAQLNAAPEDTQKKQSTGKQASEFQTLWNELQSHRKQKSNEPPKTVVQAPMGSRVKQINRGLPENAVSTGRSVSQPQDPSAFLKAMLKISDENTQQNVQPSAPKPPLPYTILQKDEKASDTPPLVQQLFDHARQNEKTKEDRTSIWYCSKLLNYYQPRGMGMPRYSYFIDEKTNLIRAHILLPDKRVFVGDPCMNHEQAGESAAKKVYMELDLATVLPNMKTLLPPPQQWYYNRQNSNWQQNIRPPSVPFYSPKPQPPQHLPQWSPKQHNTQYNQRYQQPPEQNNKHKYYSQQNVAPNELKSEIKDSTSFVPLQAQKKSRIITAKQVAKETNQSAKDNPQSSAQQKKKEQAAKTRNVEHATTTSERQKPVQNSSNQVQNTKSMVKPKKSRVAAKFCIPSQAEENHSKNST